MFGARARTTAYRAAQRDRCLAFADVFVMLRSRACRSQLHAGWWVTPYTRHRHLETPTCANNHQMDVHRAVHGLQYHCWCLWAGCPQMQTRASIT